MNENCKDCPYVEALDGRIGKIENKISNIEEKLNIATMENEKTKVYFEKIIDKIDGLIERFDSKLDSLTQRFDDKMFSFKRRLERVEKVIDEKAKENPTKKGGYLELFFNKYEKLVIAIVLILSALAGLNLSGINLVEILTK
mgnify:CR=1 FL=1